MFYRILPRCRTSHFLSRANPSELGLYLLLTAERLNGIDCYLFGFVECYKWLGNFELKNYRRAYYKTVQNNKVENCEQA
ncbi:unnamed protein product [Blepharisma stoltei]|uniref:Uncharacterized protein n=1 Tax=Blepharisma stoltei TaxID=1481888 RepID=A0AAU9IAT8_9CILI|nr:unnamed protein product [Blepharisma stoltei]